MCVSFKLSSHPCSMISFWRNGPDGLYPTSGLDVQFSEMYIFILDIWGWSKNPLWLFLSPPFSVSTFYFVFSYFSGILFLPFLSSSELVNRYQFPSPSLHLFCKMNYVLPQIVGRLPEIHRELKLHHFFPQIRWTFIFYFKDLISIKPMVTEVFCFFFSLSPQVESLPIITFSFSECFSPLVRTWLGRNGIYFHSKGLCEK